MLSLASCTKDLIPDEGGQNVGSGEGIGEMVKFTAGTTNVSLSTRADAKTYYMPIEGRFVCRMYHKPQAGSENFDITNPEDAWLRVDNEIGNSVFWNKTYQTTSDLDNFRNDNNADYLYWRNRRPHAFLAWTDMNKLNSITYGTGQGELKFSPYDIIVTTNEKKKIWIDTGYQIYGVMDEPEEGKEPASGPTPHTFATWLELKTYIESLTNEQLASFKATQTSFDETGTFGNSYYEYGWSCKYYVSDQPDEIDGDDKTSSWIKYLMYYDKFDYTKVGDEIEEKDKNDVPVFLKDANGNYLAEVVFDNDDTEHLHPHYYITDIHGNVRYNEESPRYTFYMKRISKQQDAEVHDEYRANKYDLTRGTKGSMADQPDILQALVIKEPASATLQENRIDLYFKHQFSQLQVNIKNSEDNSVKVEPDQIEKVELLGITNEGYVFTELLPNGEVRPTSYKDVVATDYTDAELAANPYGTSFNMFEREMTQDEMDATKAIKSYECITFGVLQAIRITWHETNADGGTKHEITYRVGDVELRNLKSGIRYIWNMELRRGTLAVVRTEIIPWEENQEEYKTDGTIVNTPQPVNPPQPEDSTPGDGDDKDEGGDDDQQQNDPPQDDPQNN